MAIPTVSSHNIAPFLPTPSAPSSVDSERELMPLLQQAKDQEDPLKQVSLLEQLGELALSKGDFAKAAKVFNAALVINKEKDPQYFYQKLESLENSFLRDHDSSNGCKGMIEQRRKAIVDIRNQLFSQYNGRQIGLERALVNLTEGYKGVFCSLVEESMQTLGTSPTGYAFMGMGSMARGEMCPYSDIEFAILIERDTEESKRYFRSLSRLLEVKIINLGETPFRGYAQSESITPIGLSVDSGGMSPLGCQPGFELIGTAQKLAQYHAEALTEENCVMINGLGTVCFLTGEESLVQSYTKEMGTILDQKAGLLHIFGKSARNSRALYFLRQHTKEYTPELSATSNLQRVIGLKKELYRPIQALLGDLRVFYHLKNTNSFDCIRELRTLKVFSAKGEQRLLKALEIALELRYCAHSRFNCKKEYGHGFKEEEQKDPELQHIYPLLRNHLENITLTFKTIELLYSAAANFLETDGKANSFAIQFFSD